jgi:hypothetical protein
MKPLNPKLLKVSYATVLSSTAIYAYNHWESPPYLVKIAITVFVGLIILAVAICAKDPAGHHPPKK